MTELKTLNDVFPQWLTGGGIFNTLQSYDVPWKNENISNQLDIEYFGNVSGLKYSSPLLQKVVSGETITEIEKQTIAGTIFAINNKNWQKQWETLNFEYNPIENYKMTEEMDEDVVNEYGKTNTRTDNLQHAKTGTETQTPDITEIRTDNLTHGKTGTETDTGNGSETRTDNLTHTKTGTENSTVQLSETTTPNLTTNSTDQIYGFNSNSGSNSNSNSTTSTGTSTTQKTGTQNGTTYNTSEGDTGTQQTTKTETKQTTYNTQETDTGTEQNRRTGTEQTTYNTTENDTGTQTSRDSGSDTNSREYTLTRSGNIGVTTSQQMIESERNLWKWNFFREIVFPDIDKILTLMIY